MYQRTYSRKNKKRDGDVSLQDTIAAGNPKARTAAGTAKNLGEKKWNSKGLSLVLP